MIDNGVPLACSNADNFFDLVCHFKTHCKCMQNMGLTGNNTVCKFETTLAVGMEKS